MAGGPWNLFGHGGVALLVVGKGERPVGGFGAAARVVRVTREQHHVLSRTFRGAVRTVPWCARTRPGIEGAPTVNIKGTFPESHFLVT